MKPIQVYVRLSTVLSSQFFPDSLPIPSIHVAGMESLSLLIHTSPSFGRP